MSSVLNIYQIIFAVESKKWHRGTEHTFGAQLICKHRSARERVTYEWSKFNGISELTLTQANAIAWLMHKLSSLALAFSVLVFRILGAIMLFQHPKTPILFPTENRMPMNVQQPRDTFFFVVDKWTKCNCGSRWWHPLLFIFCTCCCWCVWFIFMTW